MTNPSGYRRIAALAFPIILANCTTPLLGLTDTAVIGHFGTVGDLGAIALGSLLFSFIFWGFGFLRMGTSGFVAQAVGRRDSAEMVAVLARGLVLASVLGAALLLLQWPLLELALFCFSAGDDVEMLTRAFFQTRIWGAPACLGLYVLMGFFIGRGQTSTLLLAQLVLNGINVALDIVFAGVLGLGVRGIGLGTALAEWLTLLFAGALAWHSLRDVLKVIAPTLRHTVFDRHKLGLMLAANTDILVRTLALLFGFAWFADRGARFGDVTLAANHVLLQLVSFSAFFLDGFAFATEALVGRALGAEDRAEFNALVRRSSVLAALTAVGLTVMIGFGGEWIVARLTDLAPVRDAATVFLPFAAAYVFASFPAFQLDGIFIGATRTRALRDAALIATALFVATAWCLAPPFGNRGLWSAFIIFVIARAAALLWIFPRAFPERA